MTGTEYFAKNPKTSSFLLKIGTWNRDIICVLATEKIINIYHYKAENPDSINDFACFQKNVLSFFYLYIGLTRKSENILFLFFIVTA